MIKTKVPTPCTTECISTFSDTRFGRIVDQENTLNNLVYNIHDTLGNKLRSLLGNLPKEEDSPVEANACCWVDEVNIIQSNTECKLREILNWVDAL